MEDFCKFCNDFDIVENAMSMRTMIRWNGRDIKNRENLSEHTHLVLACAIKLYDSFPQNIKSLINFQALTRVSLIHDSLEMLRGDILSITKDIVPNLRNFITSEEDLFIQRIVPYATEIVFEVVTLADLMACYKFIEFELRYPSNDFAIQVYEKCLDKYNHFYDDFCKKYGIATEEEASNEIILSKGYKSDAGVDIIIGEDLTFMPHSTTHKVLNLNICPNDNEMAVLCARSSAAIKGLTVSMCPIDSGYSGKISAIVTNVSNKIIKYKKGESFCQVIFIPINDNNIEQNVRKIGKRSDGKLGSTL